jgi:hypothetical protein
MFIFETLTVTEKYRASIIGLLLYFSVCLSGTPLLIIAPNHPNPYILLYQYGDFGLSCAMIVTGTCDTNNSIFGLWCLTPLSAIFQLYHGGQLYWHLR